MKFYLHKEQGVILLQDNIENIGHTKHDFEQGKYIEIGESYDGDSVDFDTIFPKHYYYATSKGVIKFDHELGEGYELGSSFNDVARGKFVLLSDDQVQYMYDHGATNIQDILTEGMEAFDPKSDLLKEIKQKDSSAEVNSFYINGIQTWFTPEERTKYLTSIDAAKTIGKDSIELIFNEHVLTIDVEDARMMLAKIQDYADTCFNITQIALITIEKSNPMEIMEYRNKFLPIYPEKLHFTIENAKEIRGKGLYY